MHQLEHLARTQCAQGLDRAMADPAAAMAGHPRGFVQCQQVFILEHDRLFQALHERLRRTGLLLALALQPYRRNAHLVTGFQLAFGLGPATIHPHLAGTHDLVHQ